MLVLQGEAFATLHVLHKFQRKGHYQVNQLIVVFSSLQRKETRYFFRNRAPAARRQLPGKSSGADVRAEGHTLPAANSTPDDRIFLQKELWNERLNAHSFVCIPQ